MLIYPEFNLCIDGILLALMVSRLVEINGSIENLFRDIEKFKHKRIKIKTDPKNFIFVREKFEKMQDVTLIDGIKISPNENSWVLIRPSNTEKCIRLSVEAKNDNEASELIEKYEGKINEIIKNSSH